MAKDTLTLNLDSQTMDKKISHTITLDLNRTEEVSYIMEEFSRFLMGCGILIEQEEEEVEGDQNPPDDFWKSRIGDN